MQPYKTQDKASSRKIDADEMFIGAIARCDALATELLTILFSDPAGTVPPSREAGVTDTTFNHDDHRVLWLAAAHVAEHGGCLLPLAESALRHIGRWDDRQVAGNWPLSGWWSKPSLHAMAAHFCSFPSPVGPRVARMVAEQLALTSKSIRDAQTCIAYASHILDGRAA